ncbi:small heat shock protein, chloroplastic-like [Castanea sativa]|uniref:small heat shock protein, chloroplastic-like n=1 Tax=Castanea sativa TaxID=21020 RepID=UPI003F64B761
MATITKQLSALSSLRSIARFVHTVDTRFPLIMSSTAAEVEGEVRPYYEVKKDEQEMILKVNLPGVDNEGTKVWVEEEDHGALCFKAVSQDSTELFAKGYEGKFLCNSHLYLLDQYKSQVDNGVLKIIVPKKTGA